MEAALEQALQDGKLLRHVNALIVSHLRDHNLTQASAAVASATMTPLNSESPPNKLLQLVSKGLAMEREEAVRGVPSVGEVVDSGVGIPVGHGLLPVCSNANFSAIQDTNGSSKTQVDSSFPELSSGYASTGASPTSFKLPVRRKRSNNSDLDEINATFGRFIDMCYKNIMNQRQARAKSHELQLAQAQFMERIGNALMAINDERRNAKQNAINEIMAFSEFSVNEKLDAARLVTGESSKLDVFLLLPDDMKSLFVQRLLHP